MIAEEDLLKKHEQTVRSLAANAWKKIRKPSVMTFDDLFQEGNKKLIVLHRRNMVDDTKGNFTSLLVTSLKNMFSNIIRSSYKRKNCVCTHPYSDRRVFDFSLDTIVRDELNEREKQYIMLLLHPEHPEIDVNNKRGLKCRIRRFARKEMNITRNEEEDLRKGIERKFQK